MSALASHSAILPQPTATPDIPPDAPAPAPVEPPTTTLRHLSVNDGTSTSSPPSILHSPEPIQLSFSLPHSLSTKIHLHLTIRPSSILLFTTTKLSNEPLHQPNDLGSFVIAIPDRYNTSTNHPYTTPLYIRERSVETTTRIAKLLARKAKRPVYVGGSMDFSSAGMGGSVEEVMEGVKKVVDVVLGEIERVERETGRDLEGKA